MRRTPMMDRNPTQLQTSLSRFDLCMIVVGSAIGSGVFISPSHIARELPSPVWMIGAWIVGGLVTLAGALSFAELGGRAPGAGGVYAFLDDAYGRAVAFLYGWAYFLVVSSGAIAALAVAFSTYVAYFVPLGAWGKK